MDVVRTSVEGRGVQGGGGRSVGGRGVGVPKEDLVMGPVGGRRAGTRRRT